MKTNTISVTGTGEGFNLALMMTEESARENGLEKKQILHLRLLAEELLGILRGIAGEVCADYSLVYEKHNFELHLKSEVKMTEKMRDQFIEASSSGKNSASKGLMGKIRVLIGDIMLSTKEALPYALINTAAAYPMGGVAGECSAVWDMDDYLEDIRRKVDVSEDAKEAWDELEKSIVAKIADDVKVRVIGKNVEIIIYKNFK